MRGIRYRENVNEGVEWTNECKKKESEKSRFLCRSLSRLSLSLVGLFLSDQNGGGHSERERERRRRRKESTAREFGKQEKRKRAN